MALARYAAADTPDPRVSLLRALRLREPIAIRGAHAGPPTLGHQPSATITKITATADSYASTDDSLPGAIYQRLRQIELERVKALNDFYDLSRSPESRDLDTLQTAVRRLAAIERYSQRFHSKPNKQIF